MALEHKRNYDSTRRAPPPNSVPAQPNRNFLGYREWVDATPWTQAAKLLVKSGANPATDADAASITIRHDARLDPNAKGSTSGFGGNGSNWVQNGGTDLIANNVLTLTDNKNEEGRSAFHSSPVTDIANGFNAQFTYSPSGDKAADGAAFIIQNDSRGATVVGNAGGGLGYGGIHNSFAVLLNLWPGANGGIGMAFAQNGDITSYSPVAPVNLNFGNDIRIHVIYDGTQMVVTLSEDGTQNVFTQSAPIKLSAVLGKTSGYVGFSAATGGAAAIHRIKDFILAPPASDTGSVTRDRDAISWNQFSEAGAAISFKVAEEYDIRAVFERKSGTGPIYLLLSAGGHPFRWALGMESNRYFGFVRVAEKRIEGNPTALMCSGPSCLWNNTRYTTVVQVRKQRVTAYLNDKIVTEWTPEMGPFSADPAWARDSATFGVATAQGSEVVLYALELLDRK